MELKLSDEDKKEGTGGGLRLSGAAGSNNSPTESNGGEDNPWDFNKPDEPIRTRSITSSTPDSSINVGKRAGDQPIILKISQVIMYVLFVLDIASFLWICSQDLSMIYVNLQKFQVLYSITEIYLIVDLVLVSVLYEFKLSLIFFALILGFLYPKKRNDHVSGSGGFAGLLGVVYFLVAMICMSYVMRAVGKYGRIITKDDATRTAALEVLGQITDQGVSYEDVILGNCRLAEAYLETSGSQTVLVLSGYGDVYLDDRDDAFVQTIDSKNVETHMAFIKTGGQYKLALVELNGVQLDSSRTAAYWKAIQSD